MSVTFHTEMGQVLGYAVRCYCGVNAAPLMEGVNYDAAVARLVEVRAAMQPCDCYDRYDVHIEVVTDQAGPEANFANSNAAVVLDVLGLDAATSLEGGSLTAEDFLNRVNTALGTVPDENGRLDYALPALNGRPAIATRLSGRTQERLHQLQAVALHARTVGRRVCWS